MLNKKNEFHIINNYSNIQVKSFLIGISSIQKKHCIPNEELLDNNAVNNQKDHIKNTKKILSGFALIGFFVFWLYTLVTSSFTTYYGTRLNSACRNMTDSFFKLSKDKSDTGSIYSRYLHKTKMSKIGRFKSNNKLIDGSHSV